MSNILFKDSNDYTISNLDNTLYLIDYDSDEEDDENEVEEVDDEEVNEKKLERSNHNNGYMNLINKGVLGIKIPEQGIILCIDNNSNCCESWGCKIDNINIKDYDKDIYVGSDVNVYFNSRKEKEATNYGDSTNHAFFDIVTSQGKIHSIHFWCDHNGYYPHTLLSKWKNHYSREKL